MIYLRGHPNDYDHWASLGNEGWGWQDVLPYFKRLEARQGRRSPQRGTGGPLQITDLRSPHKLSHCFVEAGVTAGLPRNEDFNARHEDGVGLVEVTQQDGKRCSAADAYLDPARDRPNLDVVTNAHVTRIRFDGTRASGVIYRKQGTKIEVDAAAEVICCAGAIGSPQLLMLSGVGPAERLRDHDISVVVDLPGVGGNLHDHPLVGINYRASEPVTLSTVERPWNLLRHAVTYLLRRRGPLTTSGPEAIALFRSNSELATPDLLLAFAPAFLDLSTLEPPSGHGFAIAVALWRPSSRGRITLQSADPTAQPLIDPNYLADDDDLHKLIYGMQFAHKLVQAEPLHAYCDKALTPWTGRPTEAELADYIYETVGTFYHPVGTCRMGTGVQSVVDPQLRVHGAEGLRVVDASVMPAIVSGGPNAATIMIAEKAADLVKDDKKI
jgi:choline dehydrogenase